MAFDPVVEGARSRRGQTLLQPRALPRRGASGPRRSSQSRARVVCQLAVAAAGWGAPGGGFGVGAVGRRLKVPRPWRMVVDGTLRDGRGILGPCGELVGLPHLAAAAPGRDLEDRGMERKRGKGEQLAELVWAVVVIGLALLAAAVWAPLIEVVT